MVLSLLSVSFLDELRVAFPKEAFVFRHNDGLPIKLSIMSTAIIDAICKHGITNQLSTQVTPNKVEWTIEKERMIAGAFKIGYSDNAEYLSRDSGECVIYHPPPNFAHGRQDIDIKVSVQHDSSSRTKMDLVLALERHKAFGKGIASLANVRLATQASVRPSSFLSATSPIVDKACSSCMTKIVNDPTKPVITLQTPRDNG